MITLCRSGFSRISLIAFLFLLFTPVSSYAGGGFKVAGDEEVGHPKWNVWAWGNSTLEFHGYHRFSYDWNDGNKRAVFAAPGAGSKYRLGNEGDISAEYFLDYKYYLDGVPGRGGKANSRYIGLFGGVADYKTQDDYKDLRYCLDLTLEKGCVPQFYMTLGNVLGDGVDVWFGRSFYGRRGLDLNDRFYTNPGQGADYGGGVKGINGFGNGQKIDVAAFYLRDSSLGDDIDGYSVDVRYKGIITNKDGALTLWGKYSHRNGSDTIASSSENKDGFGVGIFHEQKNVWGGYWNVAGLYREGAAEVQGIFNSKIVREDQGYNLDENFSWEVNSDLFIQPNSDWAIKWIALARKDYRDAGNETLWLSTGVRPMYFINNNLNISFESGLDYVDNKGIFGDAEGSVWKNTIALGITDKKGYNNRPIARIYGTYAVWDEDLKGLVGTPVYEKDTEGWTFGVQFESWW